MNILKRASKPFILTAMAAVLGVAVADAPLFGLRLGLGDYDQKWNFLDNDGKYFCVPTTYLNITHFLYNKGLSGFSSWAPGQNGSNAIWQRIAALGNEDRLDTDPFNGTDAEDAFEYMSEFINARSGQAAFFHFFFGPNSNWGVDKIANMHSTGALIAMGYGRYYYSDVLKVWGRNGGHYMAFAGYDYVSEPKKLFFRNPANGDSDLTRQSGFDTTLRETKNITLTTFAGKFTHARHTFDNGPFGNKREVIDTMHVIMPLFGGWNNVPGVNKASSALSAGNEPPVSIVVPWHFEDDAPRSFSFVPREKLVDWVFEHGEYAVYYITHLGRIFRVDLLSGDQKLIHVLKGGKSLMVGGSNADLYVLGDKTVGEHNEPWVAQVNRDSNEVKRKYLPARGLAMEYDPISGGPAILAESEDKMMVLDDQLLALSVVAMPPAPDGSSDLLFKIAGDGSVLTARMGDGSVRVFTRSIREGTEGSSRYLDLPVENGIRGINVVDKERWVVQDGNTLKMVGPVTGREVPSDVTGMTVNGFFKMPRSHFAAVRGSLRGPAWRNIDVDELND